MQSALKSRRKYWLLIERKWWLKSMIDALMPVAGVKMPIQAKQEQGVISM